MIALNAPIGYPDDPRQRRDLRRGRAHAARAPRDDGAQRADPLDGRVGHRPRSDERLDAISLMLLPRYAEVAAEMLPYRQRTVYEAHPELSFYVINADTPLTRSKHSEAGDRRAPRAAREADPRRPARSSTPSCPACRRSHLYDVAALLWTARRIFAKAATRIPEDPEWDCEGLRRRSSARSPCDRASPRDALRARW